MTSALTNRHDFLLLFEVTNGNPNGDPDAGNMPRLDPNTNRGIVSDVCLKRKVRNYITEFAPAREDEQANGYNIFVQQGAVLNERINEGVKKAEGQIGTQVTDERKAEAAMKWLCREYYDIRALGAVISTGEKPMKGSAFGQVRGPVQFTFGQSFHSINALEISITRCAVTKEEDRAKERTMGNKHIVPYALYAAKGYVSPAFAERTGFTDDDLKLLFEALLQMFEHDRSAARGEMVVRGLYDFEHIGTQGPNNAEQNKREARLGCAHAHKLFEGIKVSLKEGREFPQSFDDYKVTCEWDNTPLPNGVKLNKRHED
ncbi:MAG TPA: type I-C CRISPR-associated protein Cas7/Csd2 [Blastocatellia bacterium]|nr:type I-C CRISPR-associated protein Cas7/Csd2 [Blastocatellia bacterium]